MNKSHDLDLDTKNEKTIFDSFVQDWNFFSNYIRRMPVHPSKIGKNTLQTRFRASRLKHEFIFIYGNLRRDFFHIHFANNNFDRSLSPNIFVKLNPF